MLPRPEAGLVMSYAYLWAREGATQRAEGVKARPCVIVLKAERLNEKDTVVTVVPVTHSIPNSGTPAIELPPAVKRHLSLGDERSWIILDEINQFVWPGFDLHPVPGTRTRFDYGLLPPKLFVQIVNGVRDVWRQKKGKSVRRD
jgi:mRNA-degrading endonuclease toxin of MazEF toxin-antitoxin module